MSRLLNVLLVLLFALVSVDAGKCCKNCGKGKACGDACIAADATCHQTHGCACDAPSKCSVKCDKGIPCGDACIAADKVCNTPHGKACFADGLKDEM